MDEPREFQLLGDEEDISQNQIDTNNFQLSSYSSSGTDKSLINGNHMKQGPQIPLIKNTNQSSTLPRAQGFNKFKISPNNPNANQEKRLELKSIERPRSRSSSRYNSPSSHMSGIEDYIQLYANRLSKDNQIKSSSQGQLNKIEMNLKMDDLLSSVKNENNSYQILSEFSFLTGDPDAIGAENQMKNIKKSRRRRSLEHNNNADIDWLNNKIKDINELNNALNNSEIAEDSPDSDDETKIHITDDTNLKYKYTASYKIDESGSFKEQKKIVFERKESGYQGSNIPNSQSVTSTTRITPNDRNQGIDENESYELDEQAKFQAKLQIQAALDALKNNCNNLESQLDKIDNIAQIAIPYIPDPSEANDINIPLPKSVNKLRANPKISNLESNIGTGITLIKNILTDAPNQQRTISEMSPSIANDLADDLNCDEETNNNVKKTNNEFFNEFLTKSDDLLAQTQSKLEKLGKLDSINKPIAPKPKEPKQEKPIPKATITPRSPEKHLPLSTASIFIKNSDSKTIDLLGSSSNFNPTDINNSASLIDLKSWDNPPQTPIVTNVNTEPETQVDLLFDMSEKSLRYGIIDTSIKQNASYCDLIGLTSSISEVEFKEQKETINPFPKELLMLQDLDNVSVSKSISSTSLSSGFKDNILQDILDSTEKMNNLKLNESSDKANEILSLYSGSDIVSKKSGSFYENMTSINEVEEPLTMPPPFQQLINPDIQPSIDITITEPGSEMNDSNIVPADFFDINHENPKIFESSSSGIQPSASFGQIDLKNLSNISRASTPESEINSTINGPNIDPVIECAQSELLTETSPVSVSSIVRSRPITSKFETDAISATMQASLSGHSDAELVMPELNNSNSTQTKFSPSPVRKANKIKIKNYKTSKTGEKEESSSSSSEDEEDEQKFQIRIRPKSQRKSSNSQFSGTGNKAIPLLPKPPKTVQEMDELRQRRMSSGGESITKSFYGSNFSDSDEDLMKIEPTADFTNNTGGVETNELERKESIHSEYNLELPDEDDFGELSDFNEKCELKRYPDGSYSCMALVRQPFPNASLMYKNVLAKMTEVRTWTECLIKLIDLGKNGKRLAFYNAHELMSLAAEHEITLDEVIETAVINTDDVIKKPLPSARDFYRDEIDDLTKSKPEDVEKSQLPKILPFHEIELKASYKFSDLALQQLDVFQKIHTFKIQEIIFKETVTLRQDRIMALPERFMKRFTKPKAGSLIDHTPIPFEIVKFGHLDHKYLRSFLNLLQDTFWQLPTINRRQQREQQLAQLNSQPITTIGTIQAAASSIFNFGSQKQVTGPSLNAVVSSHTQEQITVKVIDEYKCKLDKECRIREHKSRTRVLLIVFLNAPDPIIEIGMNDCLRHGKEIVGRHDIIPIKTEQWISPEIFEINENILEKEEFSKTHFLKCEGMPDNLLVEIMRFRTRPRRNYELPLQVRCHMTLVGRQCEIRIECTVAGTYYTKLNEVHCEDIQIRFPLPDTWVYLFRVEKMFRYGAVHSTKHKFGKIKGFDRLMVHKTQHQGAIMEASCGMAKYEQAFKSLVWRIEQLPVKNKDIYKTHLFICKMNIQEYDKMPENYEQISQVQYSVSQICAASKSQVRSISVNTCEDPPEKWVKLKSKFEYDLDINYVFDQVELPAVDKEQCAELQHLQSESEFENTEDDVVSDKD